MTPSTIMTSITLSDSKRDSLIIDKFEQCFVIVGDTLTITDEGIKDIKQQAFDLVVNSNELNKATIKEHMEIINIINDEMIIKH